MTKRIHLLTTAAALASMLTGCAIVPVPVAGHSRVYVERPVVVVPAHRHGYYDDYRRGHRHPGRW